MEQITDLTARYRKLNCSFRSKYVYRFGWAGFYSEMNNLVLNMLWAYQNRLRFCVSCIDYPPFGRKGWGHVFRASVEETRCKLHKHINSREAFLPDESHAMRVRLKNALAQLYQLFTGNYLMKDGFYIPRTTLYQKETFDIAEFGTGYDLQTACQLFARIAYQFTAEMQAGIERLKEPLGLPNAYAAVHIRRGDKETERMLERIDSYMTLLAQHTTLKHVFVFTDDYDVVSDLTTAYPDYRFYTLTAPSEHGYDNRAFQGTSAAAQEAQSLKMFAAMECLAHAEEFVGTITSNPGMFIGMLKDKEHVHYIDSKEWIVM